MSGDEILVSIFSLVLSGYLWFRWFRRLLCLQIGVPSHHRAVLIVTPFLCGAALFLVLRFWAASDVRLANQYLGMYMLMGAAWVGLFLRIALFCGIDPLVDALDCRNSAALAPSVGLMIGLTACFAGANIGDGPGWWVVVYSAGLSSGGLLVCWLFLETFTRKPPSEKITVDRDPDAGVHFGGLLLACGLIFGRAAAGNWVSPEATLHDFGRLAWPGLVLMMIYWVQDLVLTSTQSGGASRFAGAGLIPASSYLMAAAAWLSWVGPWS